MAIVYQQIFKGHQGAITTMSTDAQGRILYTASADATIRSWNINQGQLLKVYHYFSTFISLHFPNYLYQFLSENPKKTEAF